MRIYEVFLKREGKEEFRHAGSLEAADDELGLILARETYVRRAEGGPLGEESAATAVHAVRRALGAAGTLDA